MVEPSMKPEDPFRYGPRDEPAMIDPGPGWRPWSVWLLLAGGGFLLAISLL
jgi:hypothetical protein